MIVIVSLSIFIVIGMLAIWFVSCYNVFQTYIIRINESENFIDTTLRKRFDLLNKSISIIKSNVKEEKNVLKCIVDLKSKKLSNFELDRELYEGINEFNRFKEQYSNLSDNENFLKIELGLTESESEIVAARKYYNDIITDYNQKIKTFPSNIVAKMCGYKVKTYYDGKDMYDDIKNDFKI